MGEEKSSSDLSNSPCGVKICAPDMINAKQCRQCSHHNASDMASNQGYTFSENTALNIYMGAR